MSSADDDVLRSIGAIFPSVWSLEILLALKREERPWSHDELVTTMRASELVISRALDALVAAGLASIDAELALYVPVNPETQQWVERVEQLYRKRPNEVRRVIVARTAGSASAFADAFRLRRSSDD
jgi:hypothetical protein